MTNISFQSLLLPAIFLFVHAHKHQCAHDSQDIKLDFIETFPPARDEDGRVLLTWESIRIILDFTSRDYFEMNNLTFSSFDGPRLSEDLHPRHNSSSGSESIGGCRKSSKTDL